MPQSGSTQGRRRLAPPTAAWSTVARARQLSRLPFQRSLDLRGEHVQQTSTSTLPRQPLACRRGAGAVLSIHGRAGRGTSASCPRCSRQQHMSIQPAPTKQLRRQRFTGEQESGRSQQSQARCSSTASRSRHLLPLRAPHSGRQHRPSRLPLLLPKVLPCPQKPPASAGLTSAAFL